MTARDHLNDQLTSLGKRRADSRRELQSIDHEIGATVTYLRDELGQAKASSAKIVGISPSHLTALMQEAAAEGISIPDPHDRVPFLHGPQLQQAVAAGSGIIRIVASFDEDDTLFMTGIHPDQLRDDRTPGGLRLPNVVLQLASGAWVAIDSAQVGYPGTGPRNTERELRGVLVDDALALAVAEARVSDVHLDDVESALFSSSCPHVSLDVPERLTGWVRQDPTGTTWQRDGAGFFVVPIVLSTSRVTEPEPDADGSTPELPVEDGRDHLTRWLDVLDENPPSWATGPRTARAYLSEGDAEADHFVPRLLARGMPRGAHAHQPFTVIIEQGQLQLWIQAPTSTDPGEPFSTEVVEAIEAAGFLGQELSGHTGRRFVNWLRKLATGTGAQRPPYVDLDGRAPRHYPVPAHARIDTQAPVFQG